MTTKRTGNGNRQRLPRNPLRVCASCHAPRGNVRKGWQPITASQGRVIGFTCGTCPTWDEPIRREDTGDRVRFLAVVNGSPKPNGQRRQVKRRFVSVAEARKWVEEMRHGVTSATSQGHDFSDPSRLTVRALAERWLARRAEEVGTPGGVREVTVNGYRSALDAPLRHIGDRIAREVTPGEVETMLRTLATVGGKWGRPLSHRSIVYALTALRQVFNYAVREGWLPVNPATLAKPPRATTGAARHRPYGGNAPVVPSRTQPVSRARGHLRRGCPVRGRAVAPGRDAAHADRHAPVGSARAGLATGGP